MAEKLKGKGRAQKSREIVLLPPPRVVTEREDDEPSADSGHLHVIWWDSRNDGNYSTTRPIGNDANGNTGPPSTSSGRVSTNQGALESS